MGCKAREKLTSQGVRTGTLKRGSRAQRSKWGFLNIMLDFFSRVGYIIDKYIFSPTSEKKSNGLLKKPHLLRCARLPRFNVPVRTPWLVSFSRALHPILDS